MRYSFRNRAADVPVFLPAMLVLTGGAIAVSIRYHSLFSATKASTWVWFGAFGIFFVGLLGVGIAAMAEGSRSR